MESMMSVWKPKWPMPKRVRKSPEDEEAEAAHKEAPEFFSLVGDTSKGPIVVTEGAFRQADAFITDNLRNIPKGANVVLASTLR